MDSEHHAPRADLPIAILAITRQGTALALQIQARLPGSVCHVPVRHRFALAMGAVGFHRVGAVFREVWGNVSAIICIMATGIVVRTIAPLLTHKALDPAVVVLDERGQFVISLVSGHLGGANRLTAEVARLTGGQAVITTASDVRNKPALDLIARREGLEVENVEMLTRLARAILEEEPLWVHDVDGRLEGHLAEQPNLIVLPEDLHLREECGKSPDAEVGIWVSEKSPPPDRPCLILRPHNLVVGVGCNRGTHAQEILGLVRAVFRREGLSLLSIRNLASVDVKSDEPGILDAADALGRPVYFYSRKEIAGISVPNPSNVVATHIGVRSVCEATALWSARSETVIVEKQKSVNATLAVARVAFPL